MGSTLNSIRTTIRASWRLLLILSLSANLALGIMNFVFQPIWRAASTATAVAAVKAKEEIEQRKAISAARARAEVKEREALAAARAMAEARERKAVAAAIAKEKAKGRVRRVAIAIPALGTLIAAGFEYWDYSEWKKANPEGEVQEYALETIEVSKQIADEVLAELPDALKPNPETLMAQYEWIIEHIPDGDLESWQLPEVPEVLKDWEWPIWKSETESN